MRTPPKSAPSSWFCVTCRPQTELLAARLLARQGHDAFVPTENRQVRIRHNRPRVLKRIPLVPGYVLLAAAATEAESAMERAWIVVHATPQLRGLLMNRPMLERDVRRLRTICGEATDVIRLDRHEGPLGVGSTVRIMRGAYERFEGQVAELLPADDAAAIELHLFGRPQRVVARIADLQPVSKQVAA